MCAWGRATGGHVWGTQGGRGRTARGSPQAAQGQHGEAPELPSDISAHDLSRRGGPCLCRDRRDAAHGRRAGPDAGLGADAGPRAYVRPPAAAAPQPVHRRRAPRACAARVRSQRGSCRHCPLPPPPWQYRMHPTSPPKTCRPTSVRQHPSAQWPASAHAAALQWHAAHAGQEWPRLPPAAAQQTPPLQ